MPFNNFKTAVAARFLLWMKDVNGAGVNSITVPTTITLAKPDGSYATLTPGSNGVSWTAATSGAWGSCAGYYWLVVGSSYIDQVGQYGVAIYSSSPAATGVAGIMVDSKMLGDLSTSVEVTAIPTTPLLTGDTRLDHLDADISTRSVPGDVTAAVAALQGTDESKTLTVLSDEVAAIPGGASLAEIEASSVLAKEATAASLMPASLYVAPDNAAIAATKTGVDTIIASLSSTPLAPPIGRATEI